MPSQLSQLVARVQASATLPNLIGTIMDTTRDLVGADVAGVAVLVNHGYQVSQVGAADALLEAYATFTIKSVDPVHAALAAQHGVLRSDDLFTSEAWRNQAFYQEVSAPSGLDAYMAAEIVDAQGVRGFVGVSRRSGQPSFSRAEAGLLHAACLHVSAALTRLSYVAPKAQLNPSELEIVQLVARGFTNDEIGRARGVTGHAIKKSLERLFKKNGVSTRAELVAAVGVTVEPSRWGPAQLTTKSRPED